MPVILGLRDVADYSSNERPKSWRGVIQREMPQVAPLNVMLAGVKKEAVDDPEFNWFDKGIQTRHTAINYSTGYDSTATTITVDAAKYFRAGDLIKNVSTDEVMRVTADPTASTTLIIARGWGSTAAALTDNDVLFCVGAAIAEGADVRSGLYIDPTKRYNYTQIFRHPLSLTNTGKAVKMRTGAPYQEMKRDAFEQHVMDMERAFFFGVRYEDTTGDEPKRSTGGLVQYITTNVTTVSGGTLTHAAWSSFLKTLFTYGSNEKIVFCGNQFLSVMEQMSEFRGQFNLMKDTDVYGIQLKKWQTTFGTVYFKLHPLFNEVTVHSKMAVFVEPKRLIYKYLAGNGVNRDTKLLKDRQSPGQDRTVDEFLTECGLEVHNERTMGILKNVNAFSTTS
jgi:hypothetical protein